MSAANLKEWEHAYAILDDIPSGMFVLCQDFTVLAWNKTLELWTGVSRKKMVGNSLLIHYPHFSTEKYASRIQQVFDNGMPVIFSSGLHKHIIASVLPDGRMRTFHTQVTRLAIGYHGQPLILFILHDVTAMTNATLEHGRALQRLKEEIAEREKAELAAHTSEAHMRTVIKHNADSLIVVNEDGITEFVNPAAEVLFERKREAIVGQPIGFPMAGDGMEDLAIITRSGLKSAELNTVEIEWEGKPAILASLRDSTEKKRAEQALAKTYEQLKKSLDGTIAAISELLESKDPYTAGHQKRVAQLCIAIAEEMKLEPEQIDGLGVAAMIYDIGKIAVPAEILGKPGSLSKAEYGIVKSHSEVGYNILKKIVFPWPVADMVLQHHECMDGSGYPRGLSGQEILMEARIIAVSDSVEAMVSHRPYREACSIGAAMREIKEGRNGRYDAQVVDVCIKLFSENQFSFD